MTAPLVTEINVGGEKGQPDEMGPLDGISVLIGKGRETVSSPCEAGKGPSPSTTADGTLILDLQLLEQSRANVCYWRLRCRVMAARLMSPTPLPALTQRAQSERTPDPSKLRARRTSIAAVPGGERGDWQGSRRGYP